LLSLSEIIYQLEISIIEEHEKEYYS